MNDLISRQAAIDAIAEFLYYPNNWDGMRAGFDLSDWRWEIESILSELPSSQPERKKGTYTVSGENAEWYCWYATCNECGKEWMGSRNFCPNCGADMRGEQDE